MRPCLDGGASIFLGKLRADLFLLAWFLEWQFNYSFFLPHSRLRMSSIWSEKLQMKMTEVTTTTLSAFTSQIGKFGKIQIGWSTFI